MPSCLWISSTMPISANCNVSATDFMTVMTTSSSSSSQWPASANKSLRVAATSFLLSFFRASRGLWLVAIGRLRPVLAALQQPNRCTTVFLTWPQLVLDAKMNDETGCSRSRGWMSWYCEKTVAQTHQQTQQEKNDVRDFGPGCFLCFL